MSFRKALLDFSALRYPEWQERSEADFGVMFLEALAGLADDLSYTQDRVAAEATLETATQRLSIVRLARLVDYEPRPATSATVQLQFNVTGTSIPAGLPVSGLNPSGQIVVFETGTGLADHTNYLVNAKWNSPVQTYYWDDSRLCLGKGSVEMWIVGHGFNFFSGQAILIDTQAAVSADPPIREIVHITSSDEEVDPLFLDASNNPTQVTHIVWDASEALQFDHDLSRTIVAGNILPATQGQRFSEQFAIDTPPASNLQMPLAVVRTAPNSTPTAFLPLYLYTLQNTPLVWLAPDAQTEPRPEISLIETPPLDPPFAWTWHRDLLDAEQLETAFTLDRASFIPVAKNSDNSISYEYDGDNGDTIRFGDGNFGSPPETGAVFAVSYRVGVGAEGNLAADTITRFDPSGYPEVTSVTNPFPATGGADQESNDSVRRLAPQRFVRCNTGRFVPKIMLPLPKRCRGSSVRAPSSVGPAAGFRSLRPDPLGSEQITTQEELELIRLLNRRRLGGYESYAPAPHYVALDLEVYVCARPDAFRGDVKQAVLTALSSVVNPDGSTGFFYTDNFTFGTPLEKSALEAAIQKAYGVAGVHDIQYRRRGVILDFIEMPDEVNVATNDILRVDNDPSRPERGSLRVYVDGGK